MMQSRAITSTSGRKQVLRGIDHKSIGWLLSIQRLAPDSKYTMTSSRTTEKLVEKCKGQVSNNFTERLLRFWEKRELRSSFRGKSAEKYRVWQLNR